jgi:hypothetical protein
MLPCRSLRRFLGTICDRKASACTVFGASSVSRVGSSPLGRLQSIASPPSFVSHPHCASEPLSGPECGSVPSEGIASEHVYDSTAQFAKVSGSRLRFFSLRPLRCAVSYFQSAFVGHHHWASEPLSGPECGSVPSEGIASEHAYDSTAQRYRLDNGMLSILACDQCCCEATCCDSPELEALVCKSSGLCDLR